MRRCSRLAWILVVLAIVGGVCTSVAEVADAKTFTYRNLSKRKAEVAAAVKAWNASGANIRFVKAKPGRRPQLRFDDHRFKRDFTLGETRGNAILLRATFPREYAHKALLTTMGHTAVHELGHFLGLPHPNGYPCSAMAVGDVTVMQTDCKHVRTGLVPCGPQRPDVRAVARRYGWNRGGASRVRAGGFGRCSYSDGPQGARFTRSMCGPERLTLERVTDPSDIRTASLTFERFGSWGNDVAVRCAWRLGRDQIKNWFEVYVSMETPATSGMGPAGNCTGARPDSPTVVRGSARYLTVSAEGDYKPTGGAGTLLYSVLLGADASAVGLACVDGP